MSNFKLLFLALFTVCICVVAPVDSPATNKHGVLYSNFFYYNWVPPNDDRKNVCRGFNYAMVNDYSDSQSMFVTDFEEMTNVEERYYDAGDHLSGGLDTVDIFMSCSHGATVASGSTTASNYWVSAMWEYNITAKSKYMRFGDEDQGLSIFTSYDCKQMTSDPYLSLRWGPPFKGGLRYASAFWGDSKNGSSNWSIGTEYADRLHNGQSLKYAWLDAMDYYAVNTPAVMAAGPHSYSCNYRKDNMTWDNFASYVRYYDDDVTTFCRTRRVP